MVEGVDNRNGIRQFLASSGLKDIHHRVVGDLHLTFEAMDLPADPGLSLIVYGTEPGSAPQDALKLLASWSAVSDREASAMEGHSKGTHRHRPL